jgi:hypothetical protein
MDEINMLMIDIFEECKFMDFDPVFIDPRGQLKQEKRFGHVDTLVDYEEVADLAGMAQALHLDYLQ